MVTVHETQFRNQMLRILPEVSVRCRIGTRVYHTLFAGLRTAFLMQRLKTLYRFLTSDEATTAVEYAVMLTMILVAIIIGVTSAGGGVSAWWDNIRKSIVTYGS